jgi:hypothetical protein
MTRENKPESATEKRNEYAYWAIPGAAKAVTYSLPLFHEIDFAVNEGYRKIPHGGIEEGGLLFGKIDDRGTRLEAYRPIACEHAAGPSFLLSDRDLEQLSAQIEGAALDPELEGLEVVGWFLAHTRGPLFLTDREADLFDHYFARAGMLTVLVKPERFQPTRFGFLVRSDERSLARDCAQNAIILPLPGRNAKAANGPVASIPAPASNPSAARRAAEADMAAVAQTPLEEEPPTARPVAPVVESKPAVASTPLPPPVQNRRTRRQSLSIGQVRPKEEEEAIRSAEVNEPSSNHELEGLSEGPVVPRPSTRGAGELEPIRRGGLAAVPPGNAIALRPEARAVEEIDGMPDPYEQMELLHQKKPASTTARLVMVLPLAALLGCLVGYVAYLQVPSPIISLSVKSRGENLVVTWPPEQTRGAVYAAVRVDDSTPVMLTSEEKTTGRVEVQARPDMKVELIARNWIHDSRGIVHYVKPVANTGQQ